MLYFRLSGVVNCFAYYSVFCFKSEILEIKNPKSIANLTLDFELSKFRPELKPD